MALKEKIGSWLALCGAPPTVYEDQIEALWQPPEWEESKEKGTKRGGVFRDASGDSLGSPGFLQKPPVDTSRSVEEDEEEEPSSERQANSRVGTRRQGGYGDPYPAVDDPLAPSVEVPVANTSHAAEPEQPRQEQAMMDEAPAASVRGVSLEQDISGNSAHSESAEPEQSEVAAGNNIHLEPAEPEKPEESAVTATAIDTSGIAARTDSREAPIVTAEDNSPKTPDLAEGLSTAVLEEAAPVVEKTTAVEGDMSAPRVLSRSRAKSPAGTPRQRKSVTWADLPAGEEKEQQPAATSTPVVDEVAVQEAALPAAESNNEASLAEQDAVKQADSPTPNCVSDSPIPLPDKMEEPPSETASSIVEGIHSPRDNNVVALRQNRIQIAKANDDLSRSWSIPETLLISYDKCEQAQLMIKEQGAEDVARTGKRCDVTLASWSTADAMLHFTKLVGRRRRVCGLGFSNGVRVGSGYKTGAGGQEEDLCRRIPSLYSSLQAAKNEGHYPFGPSTCESIETPGRYSDVLFTADLVVARSSERDGYRLLPEHEQARDVSLVMAVAPNISFTDEIYDHRLMYKTVTSIFTAPLLVRPGTGVLVLGPWGLGSFGNDPHEISSLFAEAIASDELGQLYEEVHFAFPPPDNTVKIFRDALRQRGIEVQEIAT
jgi:hypothetical protein